MPQPRHSTTRLSPLPVCVVFGAIPPSRSPGRYVLTLVNADKHGSWMQPFRLPKTSMPSMGIVEMGTDRFFSYLGGALGALGSDEELPTLAVEPVVSFVRSYLSGLLAPLPPLEEEGGSGLPELANLAHNAPKKAPENLAPKVDTTPKQAAGEGEARTDL
jgi:hypothetical protein